VSENDRTFGLFTRPEERCLQRGLVLTAPPAGPIRLTDKYRPRYLTDLVGQGAAVYRLNRFVETPYSEAFLFYGDTGTGKSSAAEALANELGVNRDWAFHHVKSGMMDQDAVEDVVRCMRYAVPNAGWRLVLADEAEAMSPKAKQLWLSVLEELPQRTVIVFTTNYLAKFEPRFIDRCQSVAFMSDADLLSQDAAVLFGTIWAEEGMPGDPPDVYSLPGVLDRSTVSFRRVVRALESIQSRDPNAPPPPAMPPIVLPTPTPAPSRRAARPEMTPEEKAEMYRARAFKAVAKRRANEQRRAQGL
jgi:hypothetical protein